MENNQEQNQQSQSSQNVSELKKEESESRLCNICFSFYGGAATNFMCSKCFKDQQKVEKTEQNDQQKNTDVQNSSESKNEEVKTQSNKDEVMIDEKEENKKPIQEDKSRCFLCRKKVGLTAFPCRCDYVFCNKHRLAEQHDCQYDFKEMQQKKLEKENPTISHKKIDKLI